MGRFSSTASATCGSICGMKLSISLPDDDLEFIDEFAATHAVPGRSAVLQRALRLLKEAELEKQYEAAMDEWYESGENEVWDAVVGDGLEAED